MTTEPVQTWASAEAAQVWRQGAARRAQALAAATDAMLSAAQLSPGMRVLDVAAGTGDQSVIAARIVGPSGSVLATDISDSMLDATRDAATEAGLDNVTTQVADASAMELGESQFDAAICRFGLMFVPDLDQALRRIWQALRPDARLAALVWSTEAKNPYIGLQIGIVREMGRMPSPEPTIARTVALSGDGVLAAAFERAGFRDIEVRGVPTPRAFESVDDALAAMRGSSPAQGELGRLMSDAEREYYAAELARRLGAYVQADGRCVLPGEALLAVGRR